MTDTMPYTHWAYFPEQAPAEACGKELTERFNCLSAVDESASTTPETPLWLLRASRTVTISHLVEAHGEVEAVVESHGGTYDGGESGWLSLETGQYLEAAD